MPLGPTHNVEPSSPTVLFETEQTKAHLSSIVAHSSLKQIIDFHHQNLREKTAKLDWREDPLIPKV